MDIRITDHDDIWIDGKQYVSLEKANRLAQEAGAIDYDRIQSVVENNVKSILTATNNTIGAFLGVPEITADELRAFCKKSNLVVCDNTVLDERLASQYDLGYKAGSKDANARFNILDVQRQKDLEELRAAHANLKIEFVKRLYEGLDAWAKGHKIGYTADDFAWIKLGIDAAKEVIKSLLTPNEIRSLFGLSPIPSPEAQSDKPAGDGCGFVD
jgi:hypothetical protein